MKEKYFHKNADKLTPDVISSLASLEVVVEGEESVKNNEQQSGDHLCTIKKDLSSRYNSKIKNKSIPRERFHRVIHNICSRSSC